MKRWQCKMKSSAAWRRWPQVKRMQARPHSPPDSAGTEVLRESAEACELLHRRTIRAQRVDRSGFVGITQRHSAINEFVLVERKVSLQAQPQSRPGLLHA